MDNFYKLLRILRFILICCLFIVFTMVSVITWYQGVNLPFNFFFSITILFILLVFIIHRRALPIFFAVQLIGLAIRFQNIEISGDLVPGPPRFVKFGYGDIWGYSEVSDRYHTGYCVQPPEFYENKIWAW